MAQKFIKDVPLTSKIEDNYKIPISEDSLEAKTANFGQIKEYIGTGLKEVDVTDGTTPIEPSVVLWVDTSKTPPVYTEEAPKDNKLYARMNGDWSDISDAAHVMDVTPLYISMTKHTPISIDFYDKLLVAIDTNKILYISDKSVDPNITVNLIVVYINKKDDIMTFSAFDGRISYILSLNTQTKLVSLDTERIGTEFNVYNNTMASNLFKLDTNSTNDEIKLCFVNVRDEIIIPDTGDVFNVHENSHLNESAIVISRTDDETGVKLRTLRNDFVDNHVTFDFFHFVYDPNQGVDSLRLTNHIENIIDPSLITEAKMKAIRSGLVQVFDASSLIETVNKTVTNEFKEQLIKAIDLGYVIQIKDTVTSPGDTNLITISTAAIDAQDICLITASETTTTKIVINKDTNMVTMEQLTTVAPSDGTYYVQYNGEWVDINDALGPAIRIVDEINRETV